MTSVEWEIPEVFLARMAALLGDEFPAFLASYDAASSVGLRVNTLKITVEAFREIALFDLTPVPWCPAGFEIAPNAVHSKITDFQPGIEASAGLVANGMQSAEASIQEAGGPSPGKHPYHAAGLYYLQDPAAMAVAELLAPQPGERVLDLAAAPGGKTTHIASLMRNEGLLVANEIHPQRAWELAGNLERWGARNVAITNETPERLAKRFLGFFDAVLVDAPCSGEGMMRKGGAARREWAPELVRGCALRQTGILDHAAHMVRPGGRLVYSTCTFNPDENEGTVARFLASHPDFTLIDPPQRPGFSTGRPDWLTVRAGLALTPEITDFGAGLEASAGFSQEGQDRLEPRIKPAQFSWSVTTSASWASAVARTVRLWPHLAPGEGHFIAVLRRAQDTAASLPVKPWSPAKLPKPAEEAYRAFCAAALNMTTSRSGFEASAGCSHRGAEPPKGSSPDENLPSVLALIGSYLYALPAGLPDLTGLRYLHPGWWLGTLKKDRFEPSHALALGLKAQDAQRVLDLPPDAPESAAYLRGEVVPSPGEDGWTLVAVDGYPIGWGKRTGDRLKSHYPKGLRRQS